MLNAKVLKGLLTSMFLCSIMLLIGVYVVANYTSNPVSVLAVSLLTYLAYIVLSTYVLKNYLILDKRNVSVIIAVSMFVISLISFSNEYLLTESLYTLLAVIGSLSVLSYVISSYLYDHIEHLL